MDDSHSAFDVCFRWETPSSLTHRLESNDLRCARIRIALVRFLFESSKPIQDLLMVKTR